VALDGPVRFTEIREAVPGLSNKLLAERLDALEAAGIVERAEHPFEVTKVVVYRPHAEGPRPPGVLDELQAWADREWTSA
jgi:DNA-binding HxlR family transcriptional regulator